MERVIDTLLQPNYKLVLPADMDVHILGAGVPAKHNRDLVALEAHRVQSTVAQGWSSDSSDGMSSIHVMIRDHPDIYHPAALLSLSQSAPLLNLDVETRPSWVYKICGETALNWLAYASKHVTRQAR